MFEQIAERKQRIDTLWETLCGMQRGDVLTHEKAAEILGVGPPEKLYYEVVGYRLRRRLLKERGITLMSEPMIGYSLAMPDGHFERARDRNVRAARQMGDAHRTVAYLPLQDCDAVQAKKKYALEQITEAREKELRKQSQMMAFIMRPREPSVRPAKFDEEPRQETA